MLSSGSCLPIDYGGPVDHPFEAFSDFDLTGSITARFDAVALRFSDRLAVQDETTSLTYGDLAKLVKRIAATTRAATAGRSSPVGILLAPEARYFAAMLGVLAAGRGYIPLDSNHPFERTSGIITEAGVCVVISAGDLAAIARAHLPRAIVIDIDALPAGAQPTEHELPNAHDLACILYTSGSTGPPRGIALSHGSILARMSAYIEAGHISHDDRLVLVYSPSLAAALYPMYGALLTGASLHVLRPPQLEPTTLVREIRARAITIYHSVPTLVRHLVDALQPGERLDSVRLARLSGERAEWSDIAACRRSFSGSVFVFIGLHSTESGGCCQWFVDDDLRSSTAHPPVGRRLADRKVMIVGDDGVPVDDGEVGEIVVASRAVALGFWHGRDQSIAAFPGDASNPLARVLRTGDYGRWRPDGLMEFVGRKDHTVKLRGHRIEPGEIESALGKLPEIDVNAVVVRRDGNKEPRALVAYVKLRGDVHGVTPWELQSRLAEVLPSYMVPSVLFIVDELPCLGNLKIDRVRLAALDKARQTEQRDRAADDLVAGIARIFEDRIGIDNAGADDNVASLGGDSLHAVIVAAHIERQYQVMLPAGFIGQRKTIADIARWIKTRRGTSIARKDRPEYGSADR